MSSLAKIRIKSSSKTRMPYAEIEYLGDTEPPGVGGYLNIYYPSGSGIFWGVIQNKKKIGKDHYLIEARSHTFDLYRDFIDEEILNSFENTTISGAIHDLINAYYDTDNFRVTVNGGDDTISIDFDDGIYIGEAIDTLCKIGNLNYSVKKDADGKNHLYVYPNKTTSSHTYTGDKILSVSRFGESDIDYANYVIVKGGVGYNGKEYKLEGNDDVIQSSSGKGYGNLIKTEYDKIYSISIKSKVYGGTPNNSSELSASLYPVLTNIAPLGTADGSLTSINNINDEDNNTSATTTLSTNSLARLEIDWNNNVSIKRSAIYYSAPFDHEISIKTMNSNGDWITKVSNSVVSSQNIFSFYDVLDNTSKLKVEIINRSSYTGNLTVKELMVFSPTFYTNHYYTPDISNPIFENISKTTTNTDYEWIEFLPDNVLDVSKYENLIFIVFIPSASSWTYFQGGGGNSSDRCLVNRMIDGEVYTPNISESLTINIKWAGNIEYTAKNDSLISNEGRYPYIYKNTAINDYSIAQNMASKLLEELSSSKAECTIKVPFQYAYDIEIGDNVYVDIPQYSFSGSFIVKGYEHKITGKEMTSKLFLGTDEFDPGIYLKKLISTMDNARTK